MKNKFAYLMGAAVFCLVWLLMVCMSTPAAAKSKDKTTTAAAGASHAAASPAQDEALRLEGEKRYRANCGRCHTAPQKFPPRMMATIVRHMRVRALLTDEDMRLILHYMTE